MNVEIMNWAIHPHAVRELPAFMRGEKSEQTGDGNLVFQDGEEV